MMRRPERALENSAVRVGGERDLMLGMICSVIANFAC